MDHEEHARDDTQHREDPRAPGHAERTLALPRVLVGDQGMGANLLADRRFVQRLGEDRPDQAVRVAVGCGVCDGVAVAAGGASVAGGRGRAVVVATGSSTELGKIADALQRTEEEKTPLQKELDWVGRRLGLAVIGIAAVISVVILTLVSSVVFAIGQTTSARA